MFRRQCLQALHSTRIDENLLFSLVFVFNYLPLTTDDEFLQKWPSEMCNRRNEQQTGPAKCNQNGLIFLICKGALCIVRSLAIAQMGDPDVKGVLGVEILLSFSNQRLCVNSVVIFNLSRSSLFERRIRREKTVNLVGRPIFSQREVFLLGCTIDTVSNV